MGQCVRGPNQSAAHANGGKILRQGVYGCTMCMPTILLSQGSHTRVMLAPGRPGCSSKGGGVRAGAPGKPGHSTRRMKVAVKLECSFWILSEMRTTRKCEFSGANERSDFGSALVLYCFCNPSRACNSTPQQRGAIVRAAARSLYILIHTVFSLCCLAAYVWLLALCTLLSKIAWLCLN